MQLFNGRNLDGWYTWLDGVRERDTHGVFSVVDRQLRVSGQQLGYLATHDTYQNYDLTVEFRWGGENAPFRAGRARDSGLLLHATGPDGNSLDADRAYKAALECQIMEACIGDLMLIRGRDEQGQAVPLRLASRATLPRDTDGWPCYDPRGTPVTLTVWGRLNRRGKRPDWADTWGLADPSGMERPTQQYNTLRCRCLDDSIDVWLNGTLVNHAHHCLPRSGQILLQSEGSEVYFRRIELQGM